MSNIIKNTWKIFSRDKEYFSMIIFEPIMMLLMFSFLLSFQNRVSLTINNQDQGALGDKIVKTLKQQDYLMVKEGTIKEVNQNVIEGSSEIGLIIPKDASATGNETNMQLIGLENSPNLSHIKNLLAATVVDYQEKGDKEKIHFNTVPKKGITISASLGFLIFKLITSGSILGQLIINDRKNGIRGRIYLSKISSASYLLGMTIVFLINAIFSTLSYFICAQIFRFNFGMEHPAQLLPILFCASILSAALYTCIASFINNQQLLWYVAVLVFLPTSILSGALVPFAQMPDMMQKIGNFLPQRWLCVAVENLQHGNHFFETITPILWVLLFSLVLFAIGTIRLNNIKRLKA